MPGSPEWSAAQVRARVSAALEWSAVPRAEVAQAVALPLAEAAPGALLVRALAAVREVPLLLARERVLAAPPALAAQPVSH